MKDPWKNQPTDFDWQKDHTIFAQERSLLQAYARRLRRTKSPVRIVGIRISAQLYTFSFLFESLPKWSRSRLVLWRCHRLGTRPEIVFKLLLWEEKNDSKTVTVGAKQRLDPWRKHWRHPETKFNVRGRKNGFFRIENIHFSNWVMFNKRETKC